MKVPDTTGERASVVQGPGILTTASFAFETRDLVSIFSRNDIDLASRKKPQGMARIHLVSNSIKKRHDEMR